MDKAEPHLLLDVRPLVEVDICHLPTSLSILLVTETQNQSLTVITLNLLIMFVCSPYLCDYSPYIVAQTSHSQV